LLARQGLNFWKGAAIALAAIALMEALYIVYSGIQN